MSDQPISSDEFQQEVEEVARFLKSNGFERAPQFESNTTLVISMVYVGRHVAFTFTLDVRDQAIDLRVTRYRGGRLLELWDGGYSTTLTSHLINRCGFRGRPVPPASLPPTAPRMKRSLAALVNLLTLPCAAGLLADEENSLPS